MANIQENAAQFIRLMNEAVALGQSTLSEHRKSFDAFVALVDAQTPPEMRTPRKMTTEALLEEALCVLLDMHDALEGRADIDDERGANWEMSALEGVKHVLFLAGRDR